MKALKLVLFVLIGATMGMFMLTILSWEPKLGLLCNRCPGTCITMGAMMFVFSIICFLEIHRPLLSEAIPGATGSLLPFALQASLVAAL